MKLKMTKRTKEINTCCAHQVPFKYKDQVSVHATMCLSSVYCAFTVAVTQSFEMQFGVTTWNSTSVSSTLSMLTLESLWTILYPAKSSISCI